MIAVTSQSFDGLVAWLPKAFGAVFGNLNEPREAAVELTTESGEVVETFQINSKMLEEFQSSSFAHVIVERAVQDAKATRASGAYFVRCPPFRGRWALELEETGRERSAAIVHQSSPMASRPPFFGGGGGMRGEPDDFDDGAGDGRHFNGGGGGGSGSLMPPLDPSAQLFAGMVQREANNQRYVENLVGMLTSQSASMCNRMEAMEERASQHEAYRLSMLSTTEALAQKSWEREREIRKEQKNDERTERVMGMLEPVALGFATKLLGNKAVPPSLAPIVGQVNSAFASFTPAQLQALVACGALTEDQQRSFLDLLGTVRELSDQQAAADAAEAAKTKGNANGFSSSTSPVG